MASKERPKQAPKQGVFALHESHVSHHIPARIRPQDLSLSGADTKIESIMTTDVKQVLETEHGMLFHGDCIQWMQSLEPQSVDLLFADPPFNLKKDYGPGVEDGLTEEEYLAWSKKWIDAALPLLSKGGAFYLYNIPRWNIPLGAYLMEKGLTFRHQIAIDLKLGLPISGKLYPAHYSLLYFTNGKPRHFERPRLPIAVCRHCGGDIKDYGGHRKKLHPDGINLSDVWVDISPVRHQSTKHRGANALSEKLLERILTISSSEGDRVLDPFGGSGTTFAVAERMHRKWSGIELGDYEPIVRRLTGQDAIFAMPNLGDSGRGTN